MRILRVEERAGGRRRPWPRCCVRISKTRRQKNRTPRPRPRSIRPTASDIAQYTGIRNASPCPCILVAIGGPWICIFGAVFVDVVIVQPLTGYFHLGDTPFKRDAVEHAARIFHVVSEAVQKLTDMYNSLQPSSVPVHDRLLPAPTYRDDLAIEFEDRDALSPRNLRFESRFDFEGRLSGEYRCAIFLGTLRGQGVVIKFCEAYGVRAHRLLADQDPPLAPKLHLAVGVRGGLTMVVMDRVDGRNAHSRFLRFDSQDPYSSSLGVENSSWDAVKADVKKAVDLLHAADLVFGDLRRPNILVIQRPRTGDASYCEGGMLVDFDWAGPAGQARYPSSLNDSGDIDWAEGVTAGALIEKQHDLVTYQRL